MTAERLEELAQMAETMNIDGHEPSIHADLLDLARCARAWAAVEKLLDDGNGYSLEFWKWKGLVRLLRVSLSVKATTAIEAVEAAEGTDANKG